MNWAEEASRAKALVAAECGEMSPVEEQHLELLPQRRALAHQAHLDTASAADSLQDAAVTRGQDTASSVELCSNTSLIGGKATESDDGDDCAILVRDTVPLRETVVAPRV
jgi:hypothetical protein